MASEKALVLNFKMLQGRAMGALGYFLKINCDIEAQSLRYYNSSTKIQRHPRI